MALAPTERSEGLGRVVVAAHAGDGEVFLEANLQAALQGYIFLRQVPGLRQFV